MPPELTGRALLCASSRAAAPESEVRWLVRAYLEFVFEEDRGGQVQVARRLTHLAQTHTGPEATFAAYAVDGSVATAAGDPRAVARMGEACDIFASSDLALEPLWAELAALLLVATDRVSDAREVVEVALRSDPLGPAERQRLHFTLALAELSGGHWVRAAAALQEASLPAGMVDDRRRRWASRRLAQLAESALGDDLSREELRVVAAATEGLTPSQTAHRLAMSVRSVEFYRGMVREKLTARHRTA